MEPNRDVLVKAVTDAFPDQAEEILKTVWWSGITGCWLFQRWGMTIGVEPDGYIHS